MRFRNYSVLVLALAFGASAIWLSHTPQANAQTTTKAATPTPAATPDDEVIKVDTEVVNVLFTAQDRNRRLVTSLKQQDIRILENGQPQEIVAFSRQVDLPLSLSVLLDVSLSQQRTLPEQKEAAISFLQSVVRPNKDEVAVLSFTGETTLEQDMTNNMDRLRRSVDRVRVVPPSGYIGGGVVTNGGGVPGTPPISGKNQSMQGSTAIWDAIFVTSDEVLGPAPANTRRAIILLTDGYDTSSRKRLEDAVNAAVKAEAIIYTVGIGDNFYGGVDQGILRKVSERTGGRAFFPKDERELREAFKQIEEEMRSQYLIAYEPADQKRDGSYRTVEIQLTNDAMKNEKIKLVHRQGYFAKSETKIK